MNKYEQIKERYNQGFITDEQLLKYKTLGVLTEEQYNEIYTLRHGVIEYQEEPISQ